MPSNNINHVWKNKIYGGIGFKGIGFRGINQRLWQNTWIENVYNPDIEIRKGFTVKFFDHSGFFLDAFSNSSDNFPFKNIVFSNIAGAPFDCKFDMTENIEDYEFKIEYGYFVQIFLFGSTTPYFFGMITSVPSEIETDGIYSYKADGHVKMLESTYVNRIYSTATTVGAILTDILTVSDPSVPADLKSKSLLSQIPLAKYDPTKIEACTVAIPSIKFEQTSGLDAIKKLAGIAVNYEYGFDANGYFFWRTKSTTVNPNYIFFSGVDIPDIKLEKSGFSSIKNYVLVEVKSDTGTGTKTINSVAQNLTSQSIYGTKFEKISIDNATASLNESVATAYAVNYVSQKAFPDYKGQITGLSVFDFPAVVQEARGIARVFGQEKWHFELINPCEDLTGWTKDTGITLLQDTSLAHSGTASVSISINSGIALNSSIRFQFTNAQNLKYCNLVSFWIRSSQTGKRLKFCLGKTVYNDIVEQDIDIETSGIWQQVKIYLTGLSNLESVNYFGLKLTDNSAAIALNIDEIETYRYGRKKYELEVKKITYNLDQQGLKMSMELGSIDYPFAERFVNAIREIEAVKNMIRD